MQLRRTPPPHAPPHSPTPGGGDLGHPGGASALEEGLHLGLSWELGRWPTGHLRSPSTTRTGATKPRSPAPLCPLRPALAPRASLPDSPRSAQQGSHRVPGLYASELCLPPVLLHTSPLPSDVLQGRLSTLFSGLITFRIKAKPSPGSSPSCGCPEGEGALSLGVERGAHRPQRSAVHPGSAEGRQRPGPACLALGAQSAVGNRSWIQ